MAYNQALNTYQKTAVETADTLQLVLMCYDAAIRDLQDAKRFHEGHSMDETYEKVRHAQDIITELLVGLDYERGGEVAQNLSRLYNFILRQMIGINSRQSTTTYDHMIRILSELKDAYEQIRHTAAQSSSVDTTPVARSWQASA